MNLTCGRNPWKRASIDDSTFRAYLKNPKFLSSILPLSPELDSILRRIFECDPRRRITIPELRDLIVRCPTFTSRATTSPPTPPPEKSFGPEVNYDTTEEAVNPFHQYPAAPYTPAPSPPCHQTAIEHPDLRISSNSSSSSEGSVFSDASNGSAIFEEPTKILQNPYVPPQPTNFYGNFIALDPVHKSLEPQQPFMPIHVC